MLITAEHPQFGKVRAIENEGRMWSCAADVAQAFGYVNTNDAVARHRKTKGIVFYDIPMADGRQKVKFIGEGNLYRLIASSRLSSVEKFESWIFDELVPRTLKEGGYPLEKRGETDTELPSRALMLAENKLKEREWHISGLKKESVLNTPRLGS